MFSLSQPLSLSVWPPLTSPSLSLCSAHTHSTFRHVNTHCIMSNLLYPHKHLTHTHTPLTSSSEVTTRWQRLQFSRHLQIKTVWPSALWPLLSNPLTCRSEWIYCNNKSHIFLFWSFSVGSRLLNLEWGTNGQFVLRVVSEILSMVAFLGHLRLSGLDIFMQECYILYIISTVLSQLYFIDFISLIITAFYTHSHRQYLRTIILFNYYLSQSSTIKHCNKQRYYELQHTAHFVNPMKNRLNSYHTAECKKI